jgi:tetratricopeptide (TPR) repeat protein
MGAHDASLMVYESALRMLSEEEDPPLFWVGIARMGVGSNLTILGETNRAVFMLAEALAELREAYPGGAHSNIAACEEELGRALLDNGQFDEALAHCESANDLNFNRLELVDARDAISGLILHSRILEAKGDRVRAMDVIEDAFRRYERACGRSNHIKLASMLHHRGLLFMKNAQYSEAESDLREALYIEKEVIGTNAQSSSGTTYMTLAQVQALQGRYAEAKTNAYVAWAALRAGLPEGHPQLEEVKKMFTFIETMTPPGRRSLCKCGSGRKYMRCCAPDARQIGNDGCRCGSGKKYKRCCGRTHNR